MIIHASKIIHNSFTNFPRNSYSVRRVVAGRDVLVITCVSCRPALVRATAAKSIEIRQYEHNEGWISKHISKILMN